MPGYLQPPLLAVLGVSRKGVAEGGTALAGDTQAQIPAHGHVGLWIPTCKQGEGTEVKGTRWALGVQSVGGFTTL